jgi:phosphoglycerate kinase
MFPSGSGCLNPASSCKVVEKDAFTLGTVELMQAATNSGFSVIGGGHNAAVVQQLSMDSRLDHVSTGGGACIDFLAGEKL